MKEKLKNFFNKDRIFVFISLLCIIVFCVLYPILYCNDKKQVSENESTIILYEDEKNLKKSAFSIEIWDADFVSNKVVPLGINDISHSYLGNYFNSVEQLSVTDFSYTMAVYLIDIDAFNEAYNYDLLSNFTFDLYFNWSTSDFGGMTFTDFSFYFNCPYGFTNDSNIQNITSDMLFNSSNFMNGYFYGNNSNLIPHQLFSIDFSNTEYNYFWFGYVYEEYFLLDDSYNFETHFDINSYFNIENYTYPVFSGGDDELRQQYNTLLSQYNILNSQYNSLNSQFTSLNTQYTNLLSQYNILNNSNVSLQSQYDSLVASKNALQSQYDSLVASKNALQSQYDSLFSSYSSLSSSNTDLQNEMQDLLDEYNSIQVNYDILESNYNTLLNQYNNLTTDKYTFTELFWSISAVPFGVLTSGFNVNVLGFNLAAIITGLFTSLLLIWLIKKFFK